MAVRVLLPTRRWTSWVRNACLAGAFLESLQCVFLGVSLCRSAVWDLPPSLDFEDGGGGDDVPSSARAQSCAISRDGKLGVVAVGVYLALAIALCVRNVRREDDDDCANVVIPSRPNPHDSDAEEDSGREVVEEGGDFGPREAEENRGLLLESRQLHPSSPGGEGGGRSSAGQDGGKDRTRSAEVFPNKENRERAKDSSGDGIDNDLEDGLGVNYSADRVVEAATLPPTRSDNRDFQPRTIDSWEEGSDYSE